MADASKSNTQKDHDNRLNLSSFAWQAAVTADVQPYASFILTLTSHKLEQDKHVPYESSRWSTQVTPESYLIVMPLLATGTTRDAQGMADSRMFN
jgi:hypothetical protein